MDPLSEIISLVHAESAVTGTLSASGDWAVQFGRPPVVKLYGVVKGGCHLRIDGQKRWLQLKTGDVLMMGGDRGYVLASTPGVAPRASATLLRDGSDHVKLGRGAATFELIAGRVDLDPARGRFLIESLPTLLHLRNARAALLALSRLTEELHAPKAGSSLVVRLHAQLLLVELLRATAPKRGWLRLLADPTLFPAIEAMHARPAQAWTVAGLAKTCGVSRSTFAARFQARAAMAPLEYLTSWRMRLAERALLERDVTLGQLANELGYESQSSFSVAFKRFNGRSPRAFKAAAA